MTPAGVENLLEAWPTLDEQIALLAEVAGVESDELRHEITLHVAIRVYFLLLSETRLAENFDEICRKLRQRLGENLNIDELARKLAMTQARSAGVPGGGRVGLASLPYPVRRALYDQQGHRCAVCGWHFDSPDPLRLPTLDHRIPRRLGGDTYDNLEILCRLCNTMKRELLHIGEQGRVWTNNHVYLANPRAVAFWTIARVRRCLVQDCFLDSAKARLFAVLKNPEAAAVVDNCTVVCESHTVGREALAY